MSDENIIRVDAFKQGGSNASGSEAPDPRPDGQTRLRLDHTCHPTLYEINTRIWMREISKRERRPLTLGEVPDEDLDRIAEVGFDLVWLMGVWQTGSLGVSVAQKDPALQEDYRKALPDWTPEDVLSSPYAISDYAVAANLGGQITLAHRPPHGATFTLRYPWVAPKNNGHGSE